MTRIIGFDISHWNAIEDYDRLCGDGSLDSVTGGAAFGTIKLSERTKDPDFEKHWNGIGDKALKGPMHFYNPVDDYKVQSKVFIDLYRSLVNGHETYPATIDVEGYSNPGMAMHSNDWIERDLYKFFDTIANAIGYWPWCYSSYSQWHAHLLCSSGLYPSWVTKTKWWCAGYLASNAVLVEIDSWSELTQYMPAAGTWVPPVPLGPRPVVWQIYGGKIRFPWLGYRGDLDYKGIDIDIFDGTKDDLAALASTWMSGKTSGEIDDPDSDETTFDVRITAGIGLKVRSTPEAKADNSNKIGALAYGATVTVLETVIGADKQTWYRIDYKGKTGYIASWFTQKV